MEEIVDKLVKCLDLTVYEAKTYYALLTHGSLPMGELSAVSNVPRPKCYHVVRGLVSKGMATLITTKPMKCQALPPKLAIKNRLAQLEQSLEDRKASAELLLPLLEALTSKSFYQLPKAERIISLIEGPANTLSSIEFDLENTRNEALVAISSSPARFNWKRILNSLSNLIDRGGYLRIVFPNVNLLAAVRKDETIAKWLKEDKLKLRVYEGIHQPFSILDEMLVYVFFTDPQLKEVLFSIKIEDSRFAKLMKAYFELLWDRACPPNK
ncbi:MAG: hypothetical protein DRJ33_06745 [Candidatus Methanomethylicota archaeon]|uniref:Transcription regulator TrmB N-terminal domain-containing protein n=1 Tax=Thermoproteota archaeon TaxID=2056631 RepID=A0A497EVG3_9CREN|nr:MAG: hypothetical protein DRJ33_06745 [Candidatus Verstraetearchaeota archaeon]